MKAPSAPSHGSKKAPPPMSTLQSSMLLLFCVSGIYTAYLTQGVVSEHLQMKKYGEEQERFSNLEALNGAQSLSCFLWAWVILQIMSAAGGVKAGETAAWCALPPCNIHSQRLPCLHSDS